MLAERAERKTQARIVEALEALAADRLTEQVERLAHHARRGEVWDQAVTDGRQVGEKVMARSAQREAMGSVEQARNALPHLPETRNPREQAIDLRLALRSALLPSGDLGRVLAYLRAAEALAVDRDAPRRLGRVSVLLARHCCLMGRYDQASAASQRALALAAASGDGLLHALANQNRRQTVASLAGARRYERWGRTNRLAVPSRAALAWGHAERGLFAEGQALGEEGLQIAEAVDHPASLMSASGGMGMLARHHGDLPRALPRLERAVGIGRDAHVPTWFPRMAAAWGAAQTLAGRVADTVPLLTQAMAQTMATAMGRVPALWRLHLGEAPMLAGRLEEAPALAARAGAGS